MAWMLTSITEEPTRSLDAWSVMEIPFDGPDRPRTRHFIGFRREGCVGQVSTAVEEFDPMTRRGRTRSGRVYELSGRPGLNADAFATWGRFKHANRIPDERDVTDEVERLLTEGAK
jgi:hypothetical protein